MYNPKSLDLTEDEEEENIPQTQLQPDLGGGGLPPRPTAVGTSGSDDDDENFVRGQRVRCIIQGESIGGYSVELVGMNILGLLRTERAYGVDQCVECAFVKWSDTGTPILEPYEAWTPWEFEEKQIISQARANLSAYVKGAKADLSRFYLRLPFNDIFAQVKLDNLESEYSQKFRYQRACDLYPPSLNDEDRKKQKTTKDDFKSVLEKLASAKFTGCVHLTGVGSFSRTAMILLEGRCLGCFYSNNFGIFIADTEQALRASLMEAAQTDLILISYCLPREIILAFLSLSMGTFLTDLETEGELKYFTHLIKTLKKKKETGTVAVSIEENKDTCLIFVCDGEVVGYFTVQERNTGKDLQSLEGYLAQKTIAKIKVTILPDYLSSDEAPSGYDIMEHFPEGI